MNSNLEKFPREALQILGNLSLLSITGHRVSILPGNSFGESAAAAKLEKLEISNGNHMIIILSCYRRYNLTYRKLPNLLPNSSSFKSYLINFVLIKFR